VQSAALLQPALVQRFLGAAQAATRIESEHVARGHDVGTLARGEPCMVMELLEGVALGHHLGEASHACTPLFTGIYWHRPLARQTPLEQARFFESQVESSSG